MRSIIWTLLASGALATGARAHAQAPQRFESGPAKVSVIELYTSEGCSSCPPAERWLSGLRNDPNLWKTFVPVAFHVTYWDKLGWPDRFARREFTDRQYGYADLWRSESVYTPCFVRDGAEWRSRDLAEISGNAPASGQLTITIDSLGRASIRYTPTQRVSGSLEVWAAVLTSDVESAVERGENAGRKLRHDFTVVELAHATLAPQRDSDDFDASIVFRDETLTASGTRAVAAWVTHAGRPGPVVQATGGWLAASTNSHLPH